MKNCPICGGTAVERFRAHGTPIGDCRACGHRFASIAADDAHIAQVYDDGYFFAGGAGYSDYLAEERLLVAAGRRYGRLMRRWQKPGRALDVGSAAGFILQGLVQEGWQGIGIEPNSRMARTAHERFGLDVRAEPFDSRSVVGEQFDLVTMIQVMAHFPGPLEAMQTAHDRLRPGGHLVIETWNYRSRTARLLGPGWHEYSPPSVLHWFSPQSLANLGRRVGLQPIHRGTPTKWIAVGHAASLLSYKMGPGLAGAAARALCKLVPESLTLPYPSEDLFWIVFRKQ